MTAPCHRLRTSVPAQARANPRQRRDAADSLSRDSRVPTKRKLAQSLVIRRAPEAEGSEPGVVALGSMRLLEAASALRRPGIPPSHPAASRTAPATAALTPAVWRALRRSARIIWASRTL